jgi:hypothetical protein
MERDNCLNARWRQVLAFGFLWPRLKDPLLRVEVFCPSHGRSGLLHIRSRSALFG